MEMRPASLVDIDSVLDRLSDQNRAEYKQIGFPGTTFRRRLIAFVTAGETHCLWFGGKPQAFISIARFDGSPCTWLALTNECLAKGIGPIRVGRKFMAEAAKRHGPIVSLLTSQHPRIVKWMELLGAKLVAASGNGRLFVFHP